MPSRDASPSTGSAPCADPVPPEEFKSAFRHYPAGVAIITADDGAGPAGLTATSVIPVSAEPALLAFSLSSISSATPRITGSDTVVVHLLGSGQVELAKRFATGGIDRFANPDDWTRLPTGEPVLREVEVWLRGRISERVAAGSSTLVIANVLCVRADDRVQDPLVYQNRTWYTLGGSAVVA